MNKKNVFQYILALVAFFLLGMALAFGLRWFDMQKIEPIEGGQMLEYPDFGFTMRVPESAIIRDHTLDNLEAGGDALYAGSITTQEDGVLYLFCYENTTADSLANHQKQDIVSYYMSAGATDVRMRKFGGRPFICYRANVLFEEGRVEVWDSCETWNSEFQIVFETQAPPERVLPILATITFATP